MHQPMDAPALLAAHDRRVALIRQAANEASDGEYRSRWGDLLARCATWFSSLPYSPDLYREPGGAFRCTVETAFYAMRLAGGQKFGTNLSSEKRRHVEPQYNHAVFIAALCSGLDEPYRHFVVLRSRDQAEWSPAGHGALGPWLGGDTYALQRRPTPLPVERMRTALFAQNLIGHELLAGYEAGVLAHLFGAINPTVTAPPGESLVHKVVRQAVAVAADFDKKAQHAVFEAVQYPVPPAINVAAAVQPVVTPTPAPTAAAGTAPIASAPPAPAAVVRPVTAESSAGAPAEAEPSAADVPARAPAATPAATAAPAPDREEAGEPSRSPAASPQPRPKDESQLGLPFSGEKQPQPSVDAASFRPAGRPAPAAVPEGFDQVLEGQPNMIREFFRALREDVAAGQAKVNWTEKGLAVPKRLVGSYGVPSDTLVEHLRKRGLLVANVQAEIVFAPRAGELILQRGAE
ncbi:TraI domain-containing protein [Paraburkholderia sp. CNPSo 3274]|uniref:TraI domain-containing protein n=1 Tax=unclassified Paraburkholderia TaxID=2615204 RepID=UPI0020B84CC3|nr:MULTISPECIES: TraI domain-containing protein [unclassified Paraburkholderia]MCP3712465.1 TraI domain-containing protein [Paraburkholderia sp. CNPSo 3274]MCP3718462.1 TraI domain-containing protein [Paraburkholderia sp. CNPSo 3281]